MPGDDTSCRLMISGYSYIARRGLASIICGFLPRATITEASCFDEAVKKLACEEFFASIFEIDPEDTIDPANFQKLRCDYPRLILGVLSRCDNAGVILDHIAAGVNGYILGCSSQTEIENALGTLLKGELYVPPSLVRSNARQLISKVDIAPVYLNRKGLTGRQSDVLKLAIKGYSNKKIAKDLDLSPHTVKIHMGALLRHFAVHRRTDLPVAASLPAGNTASNNMIQNRRGAPPIWRDSMV